MLHFLVFIEVVSDILFCASVIKEHSVLRRLRGAGLRLVLVVEGRLVEHQIELWFLRIWGHASASLGPLELS